MKKLKGWGISIVLSLGLSSSAQARYYDPGAGRFITPDTIVQNPYDPQTLNRYAYVRNNPLRYIDPSGHSFFGSIGDFFSDIGKSDVFNKTLQAANPLFWATSTPLGLNFSYQHRIQIASAGVGLATAGLGAPVFLAGAAAGATAGGWTAADSGANVEQGALFGALVGGVSAQAASYLAPSIQLGYSSGSGLDWSQVALGAGKIAAQGAVQGAGYGSIYTYGAGYHNAKDVLAGAQGGAIGGAATNLLFAGAAAAAVRYGSGNPILGAAYAVHPTEAVSRNFSTATGDFYARNIPIGIGNNALMTGSLDVTGNYNLQSGAYYANPSISNYRFGPASAIGGVLGAYWFNR